MPNSFYTYQPIFPTECLGDSLYKINNNNNFAADAIGSLETLIATVSSVLNVAISQAAPVGTIQPYANSIAPAGWLVCNGDTVPNGTGTVQGVTTNFAPLYTIVGATFGSAGKLPDLRGQFVRGFGIAQGSGSFGQFQGQDIQSHNHTGSGSTNTTGGHSHTGTTDVQGEHRHQTLANVVGNSGATATSTTQSGFNFSWRTTNDANVSRTSSEGSHSHNFSTSTNGDHAHTVSVTINNTGGTETRPKNVALLYCIKY